MFKVKKLTFRAGKEGEIVTIFLGPNIPNGVTEWLTFDRGLSWTGTDGKIEEVVVYEDLSEIPKGFKIGMHDPESYTTAVIKRHAEKMFELMKDLFPGEENLLPRVIELMHRKVNPSK